MRYSRFFISFLILILGGSLSSRAQDVNNRGTRFWVGYGHHQQIEDGSNTQDMQMYFNTDTLPATVKVYLWNNTLNSRILWKTFNMGPNAVVNSGEVPKIAPLDARLYNLPCGALPPTSTLPCGGEGKFKRAILIESDNPIAAYAHIYISTNSGATMLTPVESWGYYFITANSKQQYADNCYSWAYVIADKDNTKIRITPSKKTKGAFNNDPGMNPGQSYDIVLNAGDIYQIMAKDNGSSIKNDLTGTKVKSIENSDGVCFPIAVFAGSSRTGNPQPCGSGGGDSDNQQCFPTQTWGKRYLTTPLSSSNSASTFTTNSYKVLVKDSATILKRNGVVVPKAQLSVDGTHYTFAADAGQGMNTPQLFEADKPIAVAQFMTGGACLNSSPGGDPEMIYISPIEQGINRIGFFRFKSPISTVSTNHLSLIIHREGLPSLRIDNSPVFDYVGVHPRDTNFRIVVKTWAADFVPAKAFSDSPFVGITYGLGSVESYGFNAGCYLRNLNALPSLINERDTNQIVRKKTCENSPLTLYVTFSSYIPKRVKWGLSEANNILQSATNPGTPLTDITYDSIYLNNNLLVRVDTLSDGSISYTYRLEGKYKFTKSGRVYIPIYGTNVTIDRCDSTERLILPYDISPEPKMDFDSLFSGCFKDTVELRYDSSLIDPSVKIDRWQWQIDDVGILNTKNVRVLFTTPGVKNITLTGISADGCLGDTSMSIRVYNTPTAILTELNAKKFICEGEGINLIPSYSYDNPNPHTVDHYFWQVDTLKINSTLDTAQNFKFDQFKVDSFRVKLAVALSSTCVSDTAFYALKIHSNPIVKFGFPDSCLPASGDASLQDLSTIPDGVQTAVAWSWSLTDTATGAVTTFNTQNPSTIVKAQSYPITLKVTTDKGCTSDSTVQVKFNLKPVIGYNNFSPVCESDITKLNVATAFVTNGVAPGVWVYSGQSTTSLGEFDAAAAGDGTWILRAIYTSDAGCKDTADASIIVYPKPTADFVLYPAEICEGEPVNVRNKSTLNDPANGTYLNSFAWDMGDGTGSFNRPDKSFFDRVFSGYGNYQVKLVAFSDKGCKDSTYRSVIIHALPIANFISPAFICMPNGKGFFQDSTIAPDGASMDFKWDFGDGSQSISRNPVHTYVSTPTNTPPSVQVTMIASTVYGCSDTAVKTFDMFFDKPTASFAVVPDNLCEDNEVVITGVPPATGSLSSWYWELGDDSTSDLQSLTHIYKDPGNYTIKLVVENAVGCPSDTITGEVIVNLQPVVDAGWSFVVPQGTTIKLAPIVNDSSVVTYLWTPQGDITDPTVLRPVFQARNNNVYTLTVTGPGGCTASDSISVKILLPFEIPNAFSPNGDNINDFWEIDRINEYPGVTIQVFNRYGQIVYNSVGYGKPWDGTSNGKPLPVATYYYVIKPMNGLDPIAGSVTIIR